MATKVRRLVFAGDMTMRSIASSERWNVTVVCPSNGVRVSRRNIVLQAQQQCQRWIFAVFGYPLL
jgi:hypothetical protein